MALPEKSTALYNTTGNLETKTEELVTESGDRNAECAKVAELETLLRESSGTAAEMTVLAELIANRLVLITQTTTWSQEHENIFASIDRRRLLSRISRWRPLKWSSLL